MTRRDWMVIFEADSASCAMDVSRLRMLLAALPDAEPIALHCCDRFAVQLQRAAASAAEALALASADIRSALRDVGLADVRPLRVEVLTWEDFDRDCRAAYGS